MESNKLKNLRIIITRTVEFYTNDQGIVNLRKGYRGTIISEPNELDTVRIRFKEPLGVVQCIYPSDFYEFVDLESKLADLSIKKLANLRSKLP